VTKNTLSWIIVALIPVVLILLFLITANFRVDHDLDVRYISRPPVAIISWGPAESYIVREGGNTWWDRGLGQAGNFFEFPISVHTRVSMRLFSFRWFREEFRVWKSNHRTIA
jgi:hypothetical protein